MSWGGWGAVVWESLDDAPEFLDNDISLLPQHNPQALKGLLSYLCVSAPAVPRSPGEGSPHPCLLGMSWSGLGPSLSWMNFWLG